MRSVEQAKENLGALNWSLTQAEVEALDRAASKVPKQLVQNSFQSS
jgi:pyridoxine 4-dehydrogenase